MGDEDAALRDKLSKLSPGEEKVHALIAGVQGISADWQGFRTFYELLPVILDDDALRARLAESYRASRALDREA